MRVARRPTPAGARDNRQDDEQSTFTGDVSMTLPETFWPGFLAALLYGPLGIFLAVLGFKVFDWITPRIDIQRELAEKHNVAVAIVCAAIILGICYVVASVVQ
jgi:putative membrane protein